MQRVSRTFQIVWLAASLSASALAQLKYDNPVLPGDHPDPSVMRDGEDYWSVTTQPADNRTGIFPLFHSRDLAHWQQQGSVFREAPDWTGGAYWAPEISTYGGRFYVFYSALCRHSSTACAAVAQITRPLCVGVAVSDRAEGPYQDSGAPLHCDPLGSIDAMAFWGGDHHYLLWKQDSNSCQSCDVPSIIWAQEIVPSERGVTLVGRKTEMLESDLRSWEGRVIEGPFLLKHGEYYYLFYSGAVYGGINVCSYGEGVARSRSLLGPYVKDPSNPLMSDNIAWKCPGHGSVVETPDHHFFFLHHAYPLRPHPENIREGVLDEIEWKPDGWPEINDYRGVSAEGPIH